MPRRTPFGALWGATAAANLGDGIALVVLPVVAVRLTRSPAGVAAVTVASTAAWPVFGLPAGWFVDRLDRRRLLVGVNIARAVAVAVLALLAAAGRVDLVTLCAVAAVISVAETVADTGLTSLVPMVVDAQHRGRANARVETTINLLNSFVGPTLAGALLALSVTAAATTTAVLFLLAAVGVLLMPRRRYAAATGTAQASVGDLTLGLRTLWADRTLRRLTLLTAAMNVVWASWTALFPVFALDPGPMGLSAPAYGVLLAVSAVGGVAGAPLVAPLVRRYGVKRVLAVDLVGTAALVAVPALSSDVVAVGLSLVVGAAGSSLWRVVVATVRHNRVEDRLMGRVYSASRLISWGVLPLGAAAAGTVASLTSVRTAFAAAAVWAAALIVAFPLAVRGERLDEAYAPADEAISDR